MRKFLDGNILARILHCRKGAVSITEALSASTSCMATDVGGMAENIDFKGVAIVST